MNVAFVVVVLYFIAITAISVYFSKRVKKTEDFTVAGRSLPGVVVAGTLVATCMGGGTVVGGANSMAYSNGFWVAIAWGAAMPVGILVISIFADRLRSLNLSTVPELMGIRYGSVGNIIAGAIMILSYLGITAYQFKSVGLVLNTTLGIPVAIGTFIGFLLITITSFFGGLFSVAYTDCFSAVMMLIGIGVGIPSAIRLAGGWSTVAAQLPAGHMSGFGNLSAWQVLGYFFSFFLLVMGEQTYYQRFFAAKDKKSIKKALLLWILATIFVMPMVAIGACTARALYPDIDAGQALMHLAGNGMPKLIGAVTIACIAAFIITTGNSYLLCCSVNLGWDVYSKLVPSATDRQKLYVCRCGLLGLAVVGYVMITAAPNILSMQMYAYTMYGAAVTPALLAAILWDKATKRAGLSSMIAGATLTLAWEFMGKPWGIGSVFVAAPVAILVLLIVGHSTYDGSPNPLRIAGEKVCWSREPEKTGEAE